MPAAWGASEADSFYWGTKLADSVRLGEHDVWDAPAFTYSTDSRLLMWANTDDTTFSFPFDSLQSSRDTLRLWELDPDNISAGATLVRSYTPHTIEGRQPSLSTHAPVNGIQVGRYVYSTPSGSAFEVTASDWEKGWEPVPGDLDHNFSGGHSGLRPAILGNRIYIPHTVSTLSSSPHRELWSAPASVPFVAATDNEIDSTGNLLGLFSANNNLYAMRHKPGTSHAATAYEIVRADFTNSAWVSVRDLPTWTALVQDGERSIPLPTYPVGQFGTKILAIRSYTEQVGSAPNVEGVSHRRIELWSHSLTGNAAEGTMLLRIMNAGIGSGTHTFPQLVIYRNVI